MGAARVAAGAATAVMGELYAGPFFDGALCARREYEPEWWTSDQRTTGRVEHRLNQSRAIAICMECPLMIKCAMHAINSPELEGVWGATTDETRKRMRARTKPEPVVRGNATKRG